MGVISNCYVIQVLNQIAIVLKLTPITTARGKIIPVLVILIMGIEIAIIPVAKLQIIAVLPIFAPCPSIDLASAEISSTYFNYEEF